MNLEIVSQSEVSQRKSIILRHIYGIYKDGTNEPIFRTTVKTLTWRTNSQAQLGGGEGVGSRYGERVTWKCALLYVK